MTTIYDDCSKDELLQIVSEMQNDLNLASHEIRILNKQMDKLIAENNDLRLRRKMVAKNLLNQLYGCCYVDTDSIKAESEENNDKRRMESY